MYSKFKEIEAVLLESKNRLAGIEAEYIKSLNNAKIDSQLLIDIKAYLSDLRSVLDYLNHKIPNSDSYFPICKHVNDFSSCYGKVDPATRSVLEKYQPYNKNEWLKWFNVLNNKNKHVTLVPQIRKETIETRVSAPGGGRVSWDSGVTFRTGVSVMGVPIDPRTQLPVPNNIVKTERIIWVDFIFDRTVAPTVLPDNLSALPFLKIIFTNVVKIIQEIEETLS